MRREDQAGKQRLPDLCIDLFAFALRLRQSESQDNERALRRRVSGLFSRLDRQSKSAEIEPENVSLAQYALAAFLDEIVLRSSWALRDEWIRRPLQLQYFNDSAAGEVFYSKLDALRGTKDPAKLDVLEIYATCLGLGFRGKLSDPESMQRPKALAGEIGREIKDARKQGGDQLSVHWMPQDRLPEKIRRVPVWVVASVCAAAFLIQVALLNWGLSIDMESFTNNQKKYFDDQWDGQQRTAAEAVDTGENG